MKNFYFLKFSMMKEKVFLFKEWFSRLLDVYKICEHDKKGRIGFHSFRNNVSDQFKQNGAVDQFAAAQLGHKNEKISYDIYGSDIHLDVKYQNLVKYVKII